MQEFSSENDGAVFCVQCVASGVTACLLGFAGPIQLCLEEKATQIL